MGLREIYQYTISELLKYEYLNEIIDICRLENIIINILLSNVCMKRKTERIFTVVMFENNILSKSMEISINLLFCYMHRYGQTIVYCVIQIITKIVISVI